MATQHVHTDNPEVALLLIAHDVAMIASTRQDAVSGATTDVGQYPGHFDRIYKALAQTTGIGRARHAGVTHEDLNRAVKRALADVAAAAERSSGAP